jgi:sugar-specific transcriptional regulator TrmB
MIIQQLKKLGLTDKEAEVYLCVFQYQKISLAKIAALTHINRPTVYSVAHELIAKGLIAEDVSGKIKYLVSLKVYALEHIMERAERKVNRIKRLLPDVIASLENLPKYGNYSVPKIQLVDESRLKEFLIDQSSTWAKSALENDGMWWGFQDHTLLEYYQDWPDYFWKRFSKGIEMYVLTNKKPIEAMTMSRKVYATKRHIKYWKESTEFTSTQVVVGDYVLMIMTCEHPHSMIEIHDRVMATNLREFFKSVWKMVD